MRALFVLMAVGFAVGCTTVPQKEFRDYTEAFAEVKATTEQLLLDYDAAKKEEAKRKATPASPAQPARPYPSSVSLAIAANDADLVDEMAMRRQTLEVVTSYNKALTALAEGRKPEEVKESVGSLLSGLQNVGSFVKAGFSISYVGQAAALISTVVAELEKANNRKQFVVALHNGAPIIRGILQNVAADAEDLYRIRAKQADRKRKDFRDVVATHVRQMRKVAGEHAMPTGNLVKRLSDIEKKVRTTLDRAGLTENSEKLPTTGQAAVTELIASQLEQTLVQAETAAKKYRAVLDEQNAYQGLVISYGRMLRQTELSLDAVRAALDAPLDIHAQAQQLITFVFAVKRDWETLRAARRAAAGT